LNEIIAAKAISWHSRGVVAVDIAGPVEASFRFADYRDLFAECRRAGLGLTVHAGETGGPEEVREAIEALEPTRIGHGIKSAYDPQVMAMLRERGIVLEVCPTSNLTTRVVHNVEEMRFILRSLIENEVRFTLSTDGPEMLQSHLRDEVALLLRTGIMSLDEIGRAIETAHAASFLDPPPLNGEVAASARPLPSGRAPISLEVEV
jgi:adenosine deaminase